MRKALGLRRDSADHDVGLTPELIEPEPADLAPLKAA
jgi:hypothetical protein